MPRYRQVGNVLGEANCIKSLGDVALERSDRDTARQRYQEALGLYGKIPEPYSMGLTHHRLARLQPDGPERQRHAERARWLWEGIGRRDLVQGLVRSSF